jgi:hypothetical protein
MSETTDSAGAGAHAAIPQKYEPPRPPPLPEDYAQFLESRTERERRLLEFAQEKLKSSFFVQWCHMYQKWKATNK